MFLSCLSSPVFAGSRWELHALNKTAENHPDNPVINLMLGDLLYGVCDDSEAAAACFRKAGDSIEARRNLAVVLYHLDGRNPEPVKIMDALVKEYPKNLQLLYEYQMLCFLTEKDPSQILQFWEDHREDECRRDDLYIQGVHAANLAGKHDYALKLLSEHDFTPCEGGEHAVADEYLAAKRETGLKPFLREEV